MQFDSCFFGAQALAPGEESEYHGSRFADIKAALQQDAYYKIWGTTNDPVLPTYGVTLGRIVRGMAPWGKPWRLRQAAGRTLDSPQDMRWGNDRQGFRRLLHPNGVCLFGKWIIDQPTNYTGYFQSPCTALIIARYSTCCTECRRGRTRSLSLVGKLFPTDDSDHTQPLRTANFITQEDLGGTRTLSLNDVVLRNAPHTTPWRRGWGLPILLATGVAFKLVDRQPTIRQLYPIAELGKPPDAPTKAPEFMQLKLTSPAVAPAPAPDASQEWNSKRWDPASIDFRDEIMGRTYDRGNEQPQRTLEFSIEVSDRGRTIGKIWERRLISHWKPIGKIIFDSAVVSYSGDFVLHFQHPRWRRNRNDPHSVTRRR